METVEVVIRIPKKKYDVLMETGDCSLNHNERAIKHGTVLPKGHGKIVDTRLAYQNTMQYSEQTRKMIMKVIDDSVIIEADKEV